ncbi:hypothetical protein EYF80_017506 [Liparis tanakae]|uniref:Uncharacterized protein n=1 Tax=Liparis tanakae TaxID=230148 RepID=A0A4Z2I4P0_9TELE|nr:hypothetical protein EYF80_017506 [Liparis tanakae]
MNHGLLPCFDMGSEYEGGPSASNHWLITGLGKGNQASAANASRAKRPARSAGTTSSRSVSCSLVLPHCKKSPPSFGWFKSSVNSFEQTDDLFKLFRCEPRGHMSSRTAQHKLCLPVMALMSHESDKLMFMN